MVRTFCSGIYLQLMIVMCFKKTSNIWRWSFISGWWRFWWCSSPKCNYDSVLIKVTCSGKVWGNGRFCKVSVVIKTRFFSFNTFKMNKSLFKRIQSPSSFEQTVLWEHTNLSGDLRTSNSKKTSALPDRNFAMHSVSSKSSTFCRISSKEKLSWTVCIIKHSKLHRINSISTISEQ